MYQTHPPGHIGSWLSLARKGPYCAMDMTGACTSGHCSSLSMPNLSRSNSECSGCSDGEVKPEKMQFLNSKCVVFTYYKGDVSSTVDEHFTRALNQASSNLSKDNAITPKTPSIESKRAPPSPEMPVSSAHPSPLHIPALPSVSRGSQYGSYGLSCPGTIGSLGFQDPWSFMTLPSRSANYGYFPYTPASMYGYKQFW